MIWFTADQHINHVNIISHCGRPFSSIEEMNNVLLANINACAKEEDTLYILGDFVWDQRSFVVEYYVQAIQCKKVNIILGNHDHFLRENFDDPYLSWGKEYVRVYYGFLDRNINGQYITLCHFPMRSWNRSGHGSLHLHGHCHGTAPHWRNSLDVGVDCHNYKPVSWPQVLKKIKENNQW